VVLAVLDHVCGWLRRLGNVHATSTNQAMKPCDVAQVLKDSHARQHGPTRGVEHESLMNNAAVL
jgi:hypothetical protein